MSLIVNTKDNVLRSEPRLFVLCLDVTSYSKLNQFLVQCLTIFGLFLVYGYLQELIFTLNGFKPYGWFLTLIQFFYYTVFGYVERTSMNKSDRQRKIPMRTYLLLAILTLGTMGFSNSSLGYLNYPTEVIFKSCKLIPVLIGSVMIQRKSYGPLDYLACLSMCIGLTIFCLADSKVSPKFDSFGVFLISSALVCDAAIGNVQEKAMKDYEAPSNEVVFYSYGLGFCYLLIIMLFTGQVFDGIHFCIEHPLETYGYAFLFSVTGYLGIQVVLTLVRTHGALIAATVTTARKAVTICLSFVFFSKPFTIQYVSGGLIVVLGIYLNVYSKQHKMTFTDLFNIFKYKRATYKKDDSKLLINV